MRSFLLTPLAEEDIFEIWAFIAAHDLPAADRAEGDIFGLKPVARSHWTW